MKELAIRALRRAGLLSAVNGALTLRVDGRRVRVPLLRGVALTRAAEPWARRLLAHWLPRTEGGVVDVGVNLGQTLVAVKVLDPARPCLGFEPNPVCVAYVHELIARNRFADCTIVPAALNREDRLLRLDCYAAYAADGTASVVGRFREPRPPVRTLCVAAYRYATVAASLPAFPIGIVKIDVEGAELDVLLGMREALQQYRPVLLLEVLPVYDAAHADRLRRQAELEDLLRALDYALLRVRKRGGSFAGLEAVERIGIHGDLERCDYVGVPREKRAALLGDILAGPDAAAAAPPQR